MPRRAFHRGKIGIAATLFAVMTAFAVSQILLSAHAATYGDGHHDHGGQACVLTLAAPGGEKLLETAAVSLVVVFALWRLSNQVAQTERAQILVRAARPRAPPSF